MAKKMERVETNPILLKMLDGPKTREELGISPYIARRLHDEGHTRIPQGEEGRQPVQGPDGKAKNGRPWIRYALTDKGRKRARTLAKRMGMAIPTGKQMKGVAATA